MKCLYFLAVLTLLSSSAHAGSISFSIGGHRVRIQASSHCRSTSCASVSVSGIHHSRRKHDRFDDSDRDETVRVKAAPPAQPTVPAPARIRPAPAVTASAPPAVYKAAAMTTQTVAAPPSRAQRVVIPPAPPPPAVRPVKAVRPAPVAAPRVERVSFETKDEQADTPLGDWQTENKGTVRIAKCGDTLCGYLLDPASNDRGEVVLINMKAKTARQWTGGVYSRTSGETYYGTMALKGSNTLRVEACALGWFYCSGNTWTRINGRRTESLISSRQVAAKPRS